MPVKRLILGLEVLIAGFFWFTWPQQPADEPQPGTAPEHRIKVGMTAEEVDAILRQDTLQAGNVHWGGNAAYRRYYQLSASQQVWVEIGGSYDWPLLVGKVVQAGQTEPLEK
jgi:hypothetical protein